MYIDLKRIRANAAEISERCPLIAVVKADAYGMGAVKVAEALSGIVSSFAVWTECEAEELVKAGICEDILVLCQTKHSVFCENIVHTVFSADEAANIPDKRVAVKINTGMNRMGLDMGELDGVLAAVSRSGKKLDSIYTHLFCTNNKELTMRQVEEFDAATSRIDAAKHIAASGALGYEFASRYDYIRCGLALYSDAVRVQAKIIKLRHLKKGEYAGYGDRPLAADADIAVMNIGYRDGYRQLTGVRYTYCGGIRCRVIGVCMDVSLVDVSGANPREGDTLELLGGNISPGELGASYGTSAYEAYTFLRRVRKIYVG